MEIIFLISVGTIVFYIWAEWRKQKDRLKRKRKERAKEMRKRDSMYDRK